MFGVLINSGFYNFYGPLLQTSKQVEEDTASLIKIN